MDTTVLPAWYESYFGPDYLKIDIQKNTDKEVEFIFNVLKLESGTRLIDVACGYGRHLVSLAKLGVNVFGCDLSKFMIGMAAKNIRAEGVDGGRLVLCDNRELPFSHVFDCACNMFNSFGYFDREDDNFRMLTAIAQALKPGGLFLLDVMNRDFVMNSLFPKDWFEHDDTIILEKKRFDPVKGRSEIDVSVVDKNGKRTYHHSIRLYSCTELAMLLEAAGFQIISIFNGFKCEDYNGYHDRMLILSRLIEGEHL